MIFLYSVPNNPRTWWRRTSEEGRLVRSVLVLWGIQTENRYVSKTAALSIILTT